MRSAGAARVGYLRRDKSQPNGCSAGQHVPGVSDEGQTAGQDAADDLCEHVARDQDERADQALLARLAQFIRMGVPAWAVMLMMAVFMFAIMFFLFVPHIVRVMEGRTHGAAFPLPKPRALLPNCLFETGSRISWLQSRNPRT